MSGASSDFLFQERVVFQTIDTFEPSANQQNYLAQQLDAVSRSFALVIPFLETPLRHYLATAYLLCRVVDNIEDCGREYVWKEARFEDFSNLLQEPHRASDVLSNWERESWPDLTNAESRMMSTTDGLELWEIYEQIPDSARVIVRHWVQEMAQGMNKLSDPTERPFLVRRNGVQILETESDYNDYCYYVAGTVGQLATELVINQYDLSDASAQTLRSHAEACGRALQKTNIVKDFSEDLARGICYLPKAWLQAVDYSPLELRGAPPEWKAMVLTNVLEELREATDYLLALPNTAAGYRQASLLCLLPAYQTILLAARRQDSLFTTDHQIKISRPTMAQCIADSQAMLSDNASIRQYSLRIEDEIQNQFEPMLITPAN